MNKKSKAISTLALTLAVAPIAMISSAAAASIEKPVYRFFDRNVGAHFFTINKEERDSLIANDPRWSEEDKTFEVVDYMSNKCVDGNAKEIYRFYRSSTKTHFFTQNAAEKDAIIANDKSWTFENVAYCAYTIDTEDLVPVYRFYRSLSGSHFLTANKAERDYLIKNDPTWREEGIAYYAQPLVNVVSTLEAKGDFSTFLAAIEKAGLTEKLNTEGKFTVFAPNNQAFADFEETNPGQLAILMADTTKLKAFVLYHVVGMETVEYEARALTSAKTLQGTNVDLSVNSTTSKLMVDKATVLEADIHAGNGVIHAIDMVLTADSTTPTPTPTSTVVPTVTPSVIPTVTTTVTPTTTPTVVPSVTITIAPTATVAPTVTPTP